VIHSLGQINSPEQILQQQIERFSATESKQLEIAFSFEVDCYWLETPASVKLLAACQLSKKTDRIHILFTLTDRFDAADRVIRQGNTSFGQFCNLQELPVIDVSKPLSLETVFIPKPWGREIWYTGIEKRGVCTVQGIPLPWLTAFYPTAICASQQSDLILLKILDPVPTEVQGDLYFEMHQEKTEVYIVTHVDEVAWPTGVGKIRYGFDATTLSQYASDAEFRVAYLTAVQAYRNIRQQIDSELDRFRQQEGYAVHDPVPPELLSKWLDSLPPEWLEQEHTLRSDMDAFTHMQDLKIGDVLRVQPFTPHALQHGVRTIEFQTPHYERQILSFAQKVLTQNHWDTEDAIAAMTIQPKQATDLPTIQSGAGVQLEEVATFTQFSVYRLTLQSGASYTFKAKTYGLTIGVMGVCLVNGEILESELAYLIPAHLHSKIFENRSSEEAVCLLAVPSS